MSETKEAPKKEFTPEEIAEFEANQKAQRQELEAHYDDLTPFLEKQAAYEEALTRIEVAKMTRLEIMVHRAQIMGGPKEPGDGGERKLRREE